MNLFYKLSLLMGVVVVVSNYLVQFPVQLMGLNEILTYGAFSYPVTFLITDLANRSFGKIVAKRIVYFGFLLGIGFTVLFSTDFADFISIRIAIGSGTAFLIAQLLDERKLPYQLLNAKPENLKSEAKIIAQAGCAYNITVSTNMAGLQIFQFEL